MGIVLLNMILAWIEGHFEKTKLVRELASETHSSAWVRQWCHFGLRDFSKCP